MAQNQPHENCNPIVTQSSSTGHAPLVTLFVMAYKQEATVREAIEGAFAQTYQPLEILLSDDASPDRTFEIMREMAEAYDGPHRVVLNRNPENLGLVGHLDQIMTIVSADFVVQNAGDDVSDPERVKALAHVWRSSGRKTLLVFSDARRIDAHGRRIGVRRASPTMLEAPTPANIVIKHSYALGATCSWDRRLFDEFGPLGPDLGVEDSVLPLRAALLGGIHHIDEELLSHRAGGVASEPEFLSAHDALYGVKLRKIKWNLQNSCYYINRFRDWDYLGKEEAEAICRARIPRWKHIVAVAETSRLKRFRLLPQAVTASVQHRSFQPLIDISKYLFEEAYVIYWWIRWGPKGMPQTHLYK